MNANSEVRIVRATDGQRQPVIQLLQEEKLPVSDLPSSLNNFFVAMDHGAVIGAIGLELFGNLGLLRSMVVRKEYRNQRVASRLIDELEKYAKASGVKCIYLLTETADAYFQHKGYEIIAREEVPAAVRSSSEFSHVCPASAVSMKRKLSNVMKQILVLCTGNSCRSQMAEGYLRHFAGERASIFSAGVETHGVNRRAIETMKEDGIDISHHTSNNVREYSGVGFDYVITVCDNAKERCPILPTGAKQFHYNFPDPAKAIGTEAEIMEQFRKVREMIKMYCREFVDDNVNL